MVGIAVMLIMLTVATQSWTFRMRREKELELIFRGEQYVNALQLYRTKNGAFPLGDLKVLVQRGPGGTRFIRKLYRNPFDKEGKWGYLYLHPGGSGFINPCANIKQAGAFAATGLGGQQVPVPGMQLGGGQNIPGTLGAGRGSSRNSSMRGRMGSSGSDRGSGASELSAISPKAFNETGMSGMNLPIVGVVNCEQKASIRTYQGQTWLANWAFTPLAQGEFGGKAIGGSATGGSVHINTGLGMTGAQFQKSGPNNNTMKSRGIGIDEDNMADPYRVSKGRKVSTSPTTGDDQQQDHGGQSGKSQWQRQGGSRDPNAQDDDPNATDPNDF